MIGESRITVKLREDYSLEYSTMFPNVTDS